MSTHVAAYSFYSVLTRTLRVNNIVLPMRAAFLCACYDFIWQQ